MLESIDCVMPWDAATPGSRRNHHHPGERARSPWEWMPRPFGGRIIISARKTDGVGVYLQVVPGPMGLWQIVRVDLANPVARGFVSPEAARAWVGRAIRQGVLPEGVVVVEPAQEKGADADAIQPGGTGDRP